MEQKDVEARIAALELEIGRLRRETGHTPMKGKPSRTGGAISRAGLLKAAALAGTGAVGVAALGGLDPQSAQAATADGTHPAFTDQAQTFTAKQTLGPVTASAALNLAPAKSGEGPPEQGTHKLGDVFTDSGGLIWYCTGKGNGPKASWIPLGQQPQHAPRVVKTSSQAKRTLFTSPVDSTLQPGHHWTATAPPGGSVDLNYTGEGALGPNSIILQTGGGGTGANAYAAASLRVAPVNLNGKMVRLWFKIVTATNFARLRLYVGSGSYPFQNFGGQTIIGYDSVNGPTSEYAQPGEWVAMTVSAASFIFFGGTLDWTKAQDFRVRIEDSGAGPCTLLFGGMEFVNVDPAYPNGLVSLTFDDGYLSHHDVARPTLEQYGFAGTCYPIFDVLSQPNYMTLPQLASLQNVNGWEIATHAYYVADHNAPQGFKSVGFNKTLGDLGRLRVWMNENGFRGVNNFAWPKGFYDSSLLVGISRAFSCARTTDPRTTETVPPSDPYRLRSIVCTNQTVAGPDTLNSSLEWYLRRVKQYGGWLILTFHDLVPQGTASTATQFGIGDFQSILQYISKSNIPVRTIGDVLQI
ncbi:MAG TPA: polysaccharide deacetylase family protein [Chloroflexota bacterium]|jgi:peptidoglycan/xylan/chitin deacetylase (PgdA/CDA1 family)|nr:polysaccharide deacetylase family protein [Chloroflexota bacterium]